jgi:hypothetical protein
VNGGLICRQLAKPVRSLGQAFAPPQWKEGKDRRRAGEMGMEGRGAEDGGSKPRREEAPTVDGGVGRELRRAGEEALRWRRRQRLIHRCERGRERGIVFSFF